MYVVYTYVYKYINNGCVYIYIYVYLICIYIYIYIYISCVHLELHICMYVCMSASGMSVYLASCMYHM